MTEPVIRIRGLRFRYSGSERDVLRIPGLDVAASGLTAITGPSGVGKSTLIELLAGTLRGAYDGSLVVLGVEWRELTGDAARQRQLRRIGLIPQDYGLLTDRTPVELLDQDLADAGVSRGERPTRIDKALTAMDLDECRDRLISTLSGGQRQRVAIARMLARDVELVIADEPTANLDPHLTDTTMEVFRRLASRVPVVIITHDPAVAALCDRTVLLQSLATDDPIPSARPTRARRRHTTIAVLAMLIVLIVAGSAAAITLRHHRHHSPPLRTTASRQDHSPSPQQSSPSLSPTPTQVPSTPIAPRRAHSPLSVMTAYYNAINAKNWPKVWRLGGDNQGESYTAMVAGYAHTANDTPYLTGISGSTITLDLLAYETSGIAQLYSGTLVIHDGIIDTSSQRLLYTDRDQAFTEFAGEWAGHDRDLQITPGGLGIASYRTFDNCPQISDGCDQFIGNQIINGGLTIFELINGDGPTAYGPVESSTVPTHANVTITLHRQADLVQLTIFPHTPFCGTSAQENECGA